MCINLIIDLDIASKFEKRGFFLIFNIQYSDKSAYTERFYELYSSRIRVLTYLKYMYFPNTILKNAFSFLGKKKRVFKIHIFGKYIKYA